MDAEPGESSEQTATSSICTSALRPAYAKSLSLEEARRRIVEALGVSAPEHAPAAWWLDEATRIIHRYRQRLEQRRIYDVSTVGARIRTAREIRGLTQHQLAARLTKPSRGRKAVGWDVSNWEQERRDLPYELLQPLCIALAVSEAWLLGDSDAGGPPAPRGLLVKQRLVDWSHASLETKKKAWARAELERLRGLRGPKKQRPRAPLPEATRDPPSETLTPEKGTPESTPWHHGCKVP